jgi:DNA mismatch endonuclease (patch repair protein)
MTPSKLGPPPPPSSAAASRCMRGNVATNTAPELQLRALLRTSGYPGYRLHWRKAPGRPDIAYPGRRIAIFVNGCFWHRCPTCEPSTPKSNAEFWERKFALNAERDSRKVRELEAAGWTVLTAWECEVRSGDALRPILEALKRG